MSPVELRRILGEWRLRIQRIKDIIQPAAWTETEWRQFAQALALLVRDHGKSWIIDPNVYWDLRWKLQDGGELVCQVEHIPGDKTSLVVAQTGGFAQTVDSYTWLWAEFNLEGEFARDPYWVDGTWKDALTTLLLPLDRQSSFLLAGRTETPEALLLQEGARPNDGNFHLSLPAYSEPEKTTGEAVSAPTEAPPPEQLAPEPADEPVAASAENGEALSPVAAQEEPTPVEEAPEPGAEGVSWPEKSAPGQSLAADEIRFRRLRARTHYASLQRKIQPRPRRDRASLSS
jgi:hypothetical protein